MAGGIKIFAIGFVAGSIATLLTGFMIWTPWRASRTPLTTRDAQTGTRVDLPPNSSANFPRILTIPVQGASAASMRDTFDETRGAERRHEATDILAPRGSPVLAADDGTIGKLLCSDEGGITIYHFDPTGQYAYYYAHLDRYADGIREGMMVSRGDEIAYVGTTGNAPPHTPHLHFGIFKVGAGKSWWTGEPINPYPIIAAQAR